MGIKLVLRGTPMTSVNFWFGVGPCSINEIAHKCLKHFQDNPTTENKTVTKYFTQSREIVCLRFNTSRQLHGYCHLVKEDKTYDGVWIRGVFTSGKVSFPDGDFYEGSVKPNETPHGLGTFKLGNSTLEGNWIDGTLPEGKITYQDDSTYIGELQNGKRHGKGEYKSKGTTYKGTWVNGILPIGEIHYPSGEIYTGSLNSSFQRHGQGTHINVDYTEVTGAWKDDQLESDAAEEWANEVLNLSQD